MLRLSLGLCGILGAAAADQCSAEFSACTDTACCTNHGFGCYKRPHVQYAMCLPNFKHKDCVDDEQWLCPGWEKCAPAFGDCRDSLCCRDNRQMCLRRPNIYYAQCRLPDEDNAQPGGCKDSDSWLCPGWETCADNKDECTKSRCCTKIGHVCTLDEEGLAAGNGWHAYCREIINATTVRTEDGGAAPWHVRDHSDVSSWMCEGTSKLLCVDRWKESVAEYEAMAEELVHEMGPLQVASVAFLALLAAVCAIGCAVGHRRKMRARVLSLESELVFMKAAQREREEWAAEAAATRSHAALARAEEGELAHAAQGIAAGLAHAAGKSTRQVTTVAY